MKQKATLRLIGVLMLAMTTSLWAHDTPPTQWYRMRTPHFNIIFKDNFSREARRLANTLECLYEPVAKSLGVNPSEISIILKNQKVTFNGAYKLSPLRVEFFTFPPQAYNFVGTNDWLNLLAVHEFRHVVQGAKLRQGFKKLAYWLGGDSFFAQAMFSSAPRWFFEGDAVGIETALTQSGRGRIPYFSLLYKVNLLEKGEFSYQKQSLGSFKDELPDHYRVGYYMTTHLRRKYGPNVLADILQSTTTPKLFFTAVEEATGRTPSQIYQDTNQELQDLWKKQLQGLKITPAQQINPRNNTDYTDYDYPQIEQKGNIMVLKSGIGTVPCFVLLDEHQQERKIFTPGYIDKGTNFSLAQGKVAWVEEVPDLLWHAPTYSIIQLFDTKTNQLKTLTHKSRYSSAALSPDATKIVAFESDETYNHQLVILDAENGQVLRRLPNPENHFYITPRWAADGQHIVVIKNVQQKTTIALINTTTGERQDLLPYSEEHIGCPSMQGQYVLYNSAYSGIDNIYAIDLKNRQHYQVTSRKYGAYNPALSVDGQWLFFNDFTRDGMDVVKMPFAPQQWTPLEELENRSINYHEPLVAQENNGNLLKQVPDHEYLIEDYYPWKHCLNIHSWPPHFKFNSNQGKLELEELGLRFISKDLLSTTTARAGYIYDLKQNFGNVFIQLVYKACYPIIILKGSITTDYNKPKDRYNAGLALNFPLKFMHGQYTHKLSGEVGGDIHKKISIPGSRNGGILSKNKHSWFTQNYKASFSRYSKSSSRDINIPWLQGLSIGYTHTPYGGNRQERCFFSQIKLYFPGLVKHHSLYLSGTYKYKEEKELLGLPQLPTSSQWLKEFADIRSLEAIYAFPIGYLDWDVSSLVYIKRLRANIFGELRHESNASLSTNPHCLGLDLLVDTHLFLLPMPLKLGVRYVYSITEDEKGYLRPLFLLNF